MMGIDKKIDLYIENRYLSNQVSNLDEVNFDGFTEWKAEIAKIPHKRNVFWHLPGFQYPMENGSYLMLPSQNRTDIFPKDPAEVFRAYPEFFPELAGHTWI